MKKLLLLGAAIALCSGVAFADSASSTGGDTQTPRATAPGSDADTAGPSGDGTQGQGWGHGMRRWWHHRHGPDGGGMDGQAGMGMRFGGGPASKAARFVFAGPNGAAIIIKCADVDTTQQCADAAKGLVGAIVPMLHHRGGPPTPDATAPAPAPAQ